MTPSQAMNTKCKYHTFRIFNGRILKLKGSKPCCGNCIHHGEEPTGIVWCKLSVK